jgi:acid phosphatase type 7
VLSTISRRLVFGAASALLVGLLVAAAPSGPPAAHLVSEKQMLLQASRTSLRAVAIAGVTAVVPAPTLVAVGDIACPPGSTPTTTTCRQATTASYAASLKPTWVLALGDLQYEKGSLDGFRNSYAKSWGALKSITKPVVGNHEYLTPGAAGFYGYFSTINKRGYYVFKVGSWRVYVLNSNCDKMDCGTENLWFNQQLRDHPAKCTLMAMHHPRYSSGQEHGSSTLPRPFWRTAYQHRVDVALAGHDHDYERFRRMDGDGVHRAKGIKSFVSGTGGKSLYQAGQRARYSRYFQGRRFGVLKLTLGAGTWSWNYRTTGGRSLDSGTNGCV